MARARSETRSAPDGPTPSRARRLARGAGLGVATLGVTAALIFWPGGSDDPAGTSALNRALSGDATDDGSGAQPPSLDTVRDIQSDLDAARYDNPIDTSRASAVVTQPGPYVPMGRIQIPVIDLDVEYGNGVHESALEHGPGHWPGTPAPGQPGNAVISGHRNTHTQPFKELDVIEEGDVIVVSTGGGAPTEYTVFETVVVPEAEYADYVLRQPADPAVREITLFACHPEGNPVNRIIVQARA